jgi:hypothetical protein
MNSADVLVTCLEATALLTSRRILSVTIVRARSRSNAATSKPSGSRLTQSWFDLAWRELAG